VHFDGAGLDAVGIDLPHLAQQFLARHRPPVGRDEVMQQVGLAPGQFLPGTVVEGDLAADEIDLAPGERPGRDAGRPLGAAAQHGIDAGQHLAHRERLDHVVVGPHAQAAHAIGFLAAGREDNDGLAGTPFAQRGEDIESRQARQHQVEQQQLVVRVEGQPQARVAVARLQHLVPGEFQGIDHAAADGRIIFNDEDRGHGGSSVLGGRRRSRARLGQPA